MENILRKMINYADETQDYEVAELAADLLDELSGTFNCPSNWRNIAETLAQEYDGNDWVMENCRLWDYL